MKIRVPSGTLEANLTDRELVFVNLITQFLLDGDIKAKDVNIDTEFYFHKDDITKIVGRHGALIHGAAFSNLRNVLVFKNTIRDKYAVTLKNPKINTVGLQRGTLNLADYVLKDQQAINIYFYLMGITSVRGVVQEFKDLKSMPKSSKINRNRLVQIKIQ